MARVKRATNAKKKHKKVLKQAKGYYGSKSVLYRTANQAVMKSLNYAYIGRKHRKRDFQKIMDCKNQRCSKTKWYNLFTIDG